MQDPQYEYEVEPVFVSPNELQNSKPELDDLLAERAGNGWQLDETLRIDASSFLFIFRRSAE